MLLLQFFEEFRFHPGIRGKSEPFFTDRVTFRADTFQGFAFKTLFGQIAQDGGGDLIGATGDAGGSAHVGERENAGQDYRS